MLNRISQLGLAFAAAALCASCAVAPTPAARQSLTLATTTSTQDSGLLDVILPDFKTKHNADVKVVAVGTGQALKLGEDCNADVVLVHARKQEDDFVGKGAGVNRRDVMYNDFIVVGPANDPAKIGAASRAADAFKSIATAQAPFASRGDKSGTHTKELDVWKSAGLEPTGAWYLSVGQGMGETLNFANEKGAYTMTDRATWLAQKPKLPNLAVLFGGSKIEQNPDKLLFNPYGVMSVNPAKCPSINAPLADKFGQWLTSVEAQRQIQNYGVAQFGQSLFRPDSAEWRAANP